MSGKSGFFTWKLLLRAAIALVVLGLVAVVALWIWVASVTSDLPDHRKLAEYQPPVTTRVHAGDGKLIAEFAAEHRIYVPYEQMPPHLIHAFVSAEDKKFFEHGGLDYTGIVRAALRNVQNKISGRGGLQGASTITQQVAKNMLLTNDQNIVRKVKEAALAVRMEDTFTKEQIMELYLNEIYLGGSSYGVASAALNYFNKPLPELTLPEAALLAAMPKAPSSVNPYRRPDAAKARRDWVLGRMVANGYIDDATAEAAQAEPIFIRSRLKGGEYEAAAYFVEELRRDLVQRVGEETLTEGGLSIRSTLDSSLQLAAQDALRKGLETYDRRHDYRGPFASIDLGEGQLEALNGLTLPPGFGDYEGALITGVEGDEASLLLADGATTMLKSDDLAWAEKTFEREDGDKGLKPGDVILVDVARVAVVEETEDDQLPVEGEAETRSVIIVEDNADKTVPEGEAVLKQIPEVEGALLALDPHTGRVLAMAGGYSFWKNQFNRTTQAERQPGPSFKPFVYAKALETVDPDTGDLFTPVSQILDAPFVQCDYTRVDEDPCYRPGNYSAGRFYGLSTMRLGLEKSRNAMTVRLAQDIGMENISDFTAQIGLYDDLPPYLAMSLGAGELTVFDMALSYATLVNGGKDLEPTLFDRVQDRYGKTIFRHDQRACDTCTTEWQEGIAPPSLPDTRDQIMDPVTAYQVVHMLEGVVQRGTATIAKRVGKPLAGKTGTTDNYVDAWFMGFSPDLVVGVYVGFDEPRTLGEGEAGGRVAAPIFTDFMEVALADEPAIPFRIPSGVRLVEVDAATGRLAGRDSGTTILEAFKPGTEPGFDRGFDTSVSVIGTSSGAVDFPEDEDVADNEPSVTLFDITPETGDTTSDDDTPLGPTY